jgi:hypothetical protein
MTRFFKSIVIVALLSGFAGVTFADRGAGKRNKLKTLLNINTNYSLKNSLSVNIKTGLTYKGSLLTSDRQVIGNSVISNSLMTFQKGNTTYIIPYKQKVMVPEMKQGYTGLKLIIRSKK